MAPGDPVVKFPWRFRRCARRTRDRQGNFTRGSPGVMAGSLQRPGPARRNGAAVAVGDPVVKFPWRCGVTPPR